MPKTEESATSKDPTSTNPSSLWETASTYLAQRKDLCLTEIPNSQDCSKIHLEETPGHLWSPAFLLRISRLRRQSTRWSMPAGLARLRRTCIRTLESRVLLRSLRKRSRSWEDRWRLVSWKEQRLVWLAKKCKRWFRSSSKTLKTWPSFAYIPQPNSTIKWRK